LRHWKRVRPLRCREDRRNFPPRLPGVIPPPVVCSGDDVKNAIHRNRDTHAAAMVITSDPTRTIFGDPREFFFQNHHAVT
jgi:hypothetical protein